MNVGLCLTQRFSPKGCAIICNKNGALLIFDEGSPERSWPGRPAPSNFRVKPDRLLYGQVHRRRIGRWGEFGQAEQ